MSEVSVLLSAPEVLMVRQAMKVCEPDGYEEAMDELEEEIRSAERLWDSDKEHGEILMLANSDTLLMVAESTRSMKSSFENQTEYGSAPEWGELYRKIENQLVRQGVPIR